MMMERDVVVCRCCCLLLSLCDDDAISALSSIGNLSYYLHYWPEIHSVSLIYATRSFCNATFFNPKMIHLRITLGLLSS